MKSKRSWNYIGSVFSDPCPGLADAWDVYIARTRDNKFHISYTGGDEGFEVGDAKEAAKWIECDSGLDDAYEVAKKLRGIRGYRNLADLLDGGDTT